MELGAGRRVSEDCVWFTVKGRQRQVHGIRRNKNIPTNLTRIILVTTCKATGGNRPAQWLSQEFRLKIRARQGSRTRSERRRQGCDIVAESGGEEECVSERDGEASTREHLVSWG